MASSNPTKNGLDRSELSRFAEKARISPTYAYEIQTGKKTPNLERATRIFARTGRKFGPLTNEADRTCAIIAGVMKRAGILNDAA